VLLTMAMIVALLVASSGVASATHDPSKEGPGYNFVKGTSGFTSFLYEYKVDAKAKPIGPKLRVLFRLIATRRVGL
jgi:hypothetical protein